MGASNHHVCKTLNIEFTTPNPEVAVLLVEMEKGTAQRYVIGSAPKTIATTAETILNFAHEHKVCRIATNVSGVGGQLADTLRILDNNNVFEHLEVRPWLLTTS